MTDDVHLLGGVTKEHSFACFLTLFQLAVTCKSGHCSVRGRRYILRFSPIGQCIFIDLVHVRLERIHVQPRVFKGSFIADHDIPH